MFANTIDRLFLAAFFIGGFVVLFSTVATPTMGLAKIGIADQLALAGEKMLNHD